MFHRAFPVSLHATESKPRESILELAAEKAAKIREFNLKRKAQREAKLQARAEGAAAAGQPGGSPAAGGRGGGRGGRGGRGSSGELDRVIAQNLTKGPMTRDSLRNEWSNLSQALDFGGSVAGEWL